MPRYVATVMLTSLEFEADSDDDAAQYAYEEYINITDTVKVYVKEVK